MVKNHKANRWMKRNLDNFLSDEELPSSRRVENLGDNFVLYEYKYDDNNEVNGIFVTKKYKMENGSASEGDLGYLDIYRGMNNPKAKLIVRELKTAIKEGRGIRFIALKFEKGYDDPADFEYRYGGVIGGTNIKEFRGVKSCPRGSKYIPGYRRKDGVWIEGSCRKGK